MRMFLDDERMPASDCWVIVRSFDEATTWVLTHGCPQFISFDNDLGDGKEGWQFAQWLIDYDLDTGKMPLDFGFEVHSQNPVRAADIKARLNRYLDYRTNLPLPKP